VGGREIHPVNVRVGGFYHAPSETELRTLLPELEWGVEKARQTVAWTGKLPFPDFTRDYEFVALRHPDEYPITEGKLVSSRGLDIEIRDYEKHFVEEHVEHSNALHSKIVGRDSYFCGPLARYNLNADRLTPAARKAAAEAGLAVPCLNPFKGIVARAVENLYAFEEALRLARAYVPPEPPAVEVPAREGVGWGCTEAPRGILYHRYALDGNGLIRDAKIVPPTSQNLKTIEGDLFQLGARLAAMTLPKATALAEQAVRNYDPCISCATHFLRLAIERE
jgi:sulfhydrogenase subunit alpha